MIRSFTIIFLSVLILITTVTAKENNISNDQKKVLGLILNMTNAFHKGDIEGVMASYESHATVVFEPGVPISDPDMLRKMFTQMFTLKPKFSFSGHEVFIMNDIAVHSAPWTMVAHAADGSVINQSGLSVAVLRRQRNGAWLMVIDNPHGQILMK